MLDLTFLSQVHAIFAGLHLCRCCKPLQSSQARCTRQWTPHLLKRTKKWQDVSDSFILGRTPRKNSMTSGIYFNSDSQSVLRNKDDQGERSYSICRIPSNFNWRAIGFASRVQCCKMIWHYNGNDTLGKNHQSLFDFIAGLWVLGQKSNLLTFPCLSVLYKNYINKNLSNLWNKINSNIL